MFLRVVFRYEAVIFDKELGTVGSWLYISKITPNPTQKMLEIEAHPT